LSLTRTDRGVCEYGHLVKRLRVRGLEISYQRVGQGPPLVLVHGAADDARIWQPQLSALSDAFTVVAWDEPGAGRSSDLPAAFALPDYAHCLAALIDELGLGPAHVCGLSWGGTVVLELYRQHPDAVTTLILADTYAGWKGSLSADDVAARVDGLRRMLAAPVQDFDPSLPGLFAGTPPAQYASLLADIASGVRRDTLGIQLGLMAEADQRDVLATITVPTLLIWGEQDARSPVNVAHQFADGISGSELVVIPDCGHLSNLDQPMAFNRAVRDFCLSHA
jgi:pimeloyl-ACP methyl ester carboxylesterase